MFIASSLRRVRRLTRQLFVSSVFLFAALGMSLGARAQTTQSYAGRPFIRVAQLSVFDPVSGSPSAFGNSQLVGNSVYFGALSGATTTGIYSGRGAAHGRIASLGSDLDGVTANSFHYGFARETGGNSVVIAAGVATPDILFLTDGTNTSTLVAAGAVLPNSGGQVVNSFGEPFYAGGKVAVIAKHLVPKGDGTNFMGVYRVNNGALETVAGTATALPGGFGLPSDFLSQLGFDGETIAFWAQHGEFPQEKTGMFVQTSSGVVTKILQSGDTLPGGGTVSSIFSPPVVSAGVIYFFAQEPSSKTSLLKYENGVLTILAQNGDTTAEGGQLRDLGDLGLGVDGGKVFFGARTIAGYGIYLLENGTLSLVIRPRESLGGAIPEGIILRDVANDTLLLEMGSTGGGGRRLVANLAQPAVPVITADLTNQTVAAGARVEFKVTALGDEPLAYYWTLADTNLPGVTGNTLVLENVDIMDIGNYRVTISNAFGQVASTTALLNMEVAPLILASPMNTTAEVGDELILRVTATSGQPLSHIWKRNGEVVVSDSQEPGAFVRTNLQLAHAGTYSVIVSNAFGTATSAEAVLTVKPAAPNPYYAGTQFTYFLNSIYPDPYTGEKFDTTLLTELSARWTGRSGVVYGGQHLQGQSLGLLGWNIDVIGQVIEPNHPLGNDLGSANGFTIVRALPDEPLILYGHQLVNGSLQPVGLYRLFNNFTAIADINTLAPDGAGGKFTMFNDDAFQAGGQLVFASLVSGTNGIYRAKDGTLTRVLHDRQDLPVDGAGGIDFHGLAQNGGDIVVVATSSGSQNSALLKVSAAGEISKLLGKGGTIPGTAHTVHSFGNSGTDGEAFYFLIYDTALRQHIIRWKEGTFTRLAGSDMTVEGMGTIQAIDTSYPKGVAGKTYFSAQVNTPQGAKQGVLVADDAGIRPVLFATKLDARRVTATYVMDVRGQRFIVLVQFADGTRGIYANPDYFWFGELLLQYTRQSNGSIHFNVPVGTRLEYATEIGGPWQETDVPEVNPTDNRFYRLKTIE